MFVCMELFPGGYIKSKPELIGLTEALIHAAYHPKTGSLQQVAEVNARLEGIAALLFNTPSASSWPC